MLTPEKLNAMKKLKKEFTELQSNPITSLGVTVGLPNPNDLFTWQISLLGPSETPYEGGVFFLEADFPDNYPTAGPKIKFLTIGFLLLWIKLSLIFFNCSMLIILIIMDNQAKNLEIIDHYLKNIVENGYSFMPNK